MTGDDNPFYPQFKMVCLGLLDLGKVSLLAVHEPTLNPDESDPGGLFDLARFGSQGGTIAQAICLAAWGESEVGS